VLLKNVFTFSTFMNALAMKLSDYRDVMSDSQTSSTVAERFEVITYFINSVIVFYCDIDLVKPDVCNRNCNQYLKC